MSATLHMVRCDDVVPQPWRNGGGRTRELLAWPSAVNWQCRISVAEVERDGPFSIFPGVDRWFAVAEGAGVLLLLPDGECRLDRSSAAVNFPGEAAPRCQLLDGPTSDLNLMGTRATGRSWMERAVPGEPWIGPATLRALFSADSVTLQRSGAAALTLAPFTLIWMGEPDGDSWSIDAAVDRPRTWWMSFTISAPA
ncbi:MAG: HutD family protein [Gemmatimonadales bacterium]